MQRSIVESALLLLDRSWMPRTTVQTPFQWENDAWRDAFLRVNDGNREALAQAGEERRRRQTKIKTGGDPSATEDRK